MANEFAILHVRINQGEVQQLTVRNLNFKLAAAAALALLDYQPADKGQDQVVEIWHPDRMEDQGVYKYLWDGWHLALVPSSYPGPVKNTL